MKSGSRQSRREAVILASEARRESVFGKGTADSGYPNIGHRQAGMTICEFLNICLNYSVLAYENDVTVI